MRAAGFTLIEMMVAIAVAVILMTLAVPSFQQSRLTTQLRASTNDLVADVNLARGEALKRNQPVTMCVSSDGAACSTGGWQQGWIVVSGGTVIRREFAAPDGFLIKDSNGVTTLSFQPTGVDSTPAALTVCRAEPQIGNQERLITIDATGRPWITRTANGSCS